MVEESELEITFAEKPDVSNLKEFTEEEVNRLLAALPRTKYEYGQKVVECREHMDLAKYSYEREKAKQQQIASASKDELGLGSEKDRMAWALDQPTVVEAELEYVEAKSAHAIAELRWQYTDDLFTAVRKMANQIEEGLKAQAQNARYSSPEAP